MSRCQTTDEEGEENENASLRSMMSNKSDDNESDESLPVETRPLVPY